MSVNVRHNAMQYKKSRPASTDRRNNSVATLLVFVTETEKCAMTNVDALLLFLL